MARYPGRKIGVVISELLNKKFIFRDTPLTTEEQAVLVAINPENELLYRNVGSARIPKPIANLSATDSSGDANDEASTWDVDSNNNNNEATSSGDQTETEVHSIEIRMPFSMSFMLVFVLFRNRYAITYIAV